MTTAIETLPSPQWYRKLEGKIDKEILLLKDTRGVFLLDKVDERNIVHFTKTCIDNPWANHLFLCVLVSADRNKDSNTILNTTKTLNPRLKDIFLAFNLNEMYEFNVEEHLYKYLKGDIFSEHSYSQRTMLLKHYRTLTYQVKKWMTQKLSVNQQDYFEQFLFHMPSFDSRDFTFDKLSKEQAQDTRKNETDAIVPFLPQIRSEAHFRWNQIKRLRDAFHKAREDAEKQSLPLPLEFHYDEPERVGERFYFLLWDKPSFVLHHQDQFTDKMIQHARERKSTYSEENKHHFIEFVKARSINDDDEGEGLWFTELIDKDVLGKWPQNATEEEIEEKRAILSKWGYGNENSKSPMPFCSSHKGIITSSTYVSMNKNKAKGSIFDIEPFYVACTFGLLAIDILTTTGARLNELLQINNTRACIMQPKKINNRLHYSFKAIPKGRDEAEEYHVSKQTLEIIQIVSRMLKNHYSDGKISSVEYRHDRKHLFPEPKPYYFQYNNKSFTQKGVNSCIRFLLHGLRFETQARTPVIVKTHLLRHAFATEAVQREKMPIDIVAKILHQRDLNVTGYYSAPTPTQIAESIGELQDVISNYVDLDEVLLRSPEDLQKELKEYSVKVGVFNKVLGGTCITDFVCPTKMACLGCNAKVPEPEQENELLEVIQLSKDMEKRFEKMGLGVEVRKAKEMQKQAKIELKEIDLIKKYREEQKHEPVIKYNSFW